MQKLIKLLESHYIVIDDSEIKEDDLFLHNNIIYKCHEINLKGVRALKGGKEYYFKTGVNKITHSTQPLEEIEGSEVWENNECLGPDYAFQEIKFLSLSEVEELIYGYNLEEMAMDSSFEHGESSEGAYHGFIEGFNTHKELVKDKLFTIEDIRKACDLYRSGKTIDIIIQLLLPKTEWDITFDEQSKIKLL